MTIPEKHILDYGSIQESAFVRHLPLICVIANVAMCLPLLIYEIINSVRNIHAPQVDAPLAIISLINFPSSLFVAFGLAFLSLHWKALDNSDVAPYVVESFCLLVFGIGQYYLVGKAWRGIIRYSRKRRARRQG
jgi:hypothetical protein